MIAYQERRAGKIRILEEPTTWREESWSAFRSMGDRKARLTKRSAGLSILSLYPSPYDARTVPEEAAARMVEFERRLKEIRAEREQYIQDNFRRWPITVAEDCAQRIAGKSKTEAAKDLPKHRISEGQAKREQADNLAINRALAGVF